jgi:hypothetical protein
VFPDPNRFSFSVLSRDAESQHGYDQVAHAYKSDYVHPSGWTIQMHFDIQAFLQKLRSQLERFNRPSSGETDDRPGHTPLHGGSEGHLDDDEEFDQLQAEIDETEQFIANHQFHFRVEKVRFAIHTAGDPLLFEPAQITPANQLRASVQVSKQGRYKITSVVRKRLSAAVETEHSLVFHLADILVCAIGDSYASGEGNPDVAQVPTEAMRIYAGGSGFNTLRRIGDDIESKVTLETEFAQWQESLAHRSYHAYPFVAGRRVQGHYGDAYFACTCLSYARTGALIEQGLLNLNPLLGEHRRTLRLARTQGGSSLPFVRILTSDTTQPASLDALLGIGQIAELEQAVGSRQIDFLTISIGGNDCGWAPAFGQIIKPFWDSDSRSASDVLRKVSVFIETELASKFDLLHQRLIDMPVQPRYVLLTLYPRGFFGAGTPDEPTIKRDCGIFDAFDINPLFESDSWFGIDEDEAIIIKHLANVLNDKLRDTVKRLNQSSVMGSRLQRRTFKWVIVDHIDKDFESHGYCADETFFVGAETSFLRQGDWRGTLHPNEKGQAIYAARVINTIKELINQDVASFKFKESPFAHIVDSRPGTFDSNPRASGSTPGV